ncbi:nuclear transport factor 2 family protein [Streptomyces spiramenti]|uniref:Nuclear transport factor 2 family protein n=1 Tax=Streptomyces spiramenti TaxID=2720606 RepID=A0ABX1AEA8_9ACTN|nr:nuclear transport factor 2 family protein [Streptomyces spiramenti]NJP65474.1 nuclear transport factor 2 family protein [Streptomyces spiramenti]
MNDHIASADPARRNTDLVLTAMRELFVEGDLTALERYWAEPYVQHSPQMRGGLDTLRTVVPTLDGFSWERQRVSTQGNLAFTHSVVNGWAAKPVVVVDLVAPEATAAGISMV